MKKYLFTAAATLALSVATVASLRSMSQSYDLKDPKGVNTIAFSLDALLEPISGIGSGVSGKINFDPEAPEKSTGTIEIAVASLKTGNDRLTEKMMEKGFLEAKDFPTATFKIVEIKKVNRKDNTYNFEVEGDFTLKGITKRKTVIAEAIYVKDGVSRRSGNLEGDLISIKCSFGFSRTEHGVDGGLPLELIGDRVSVTLNVAAQAIRN